MARPQRTTAARAVRSRQLTLALSLLALGMSVALAACSNSILRNAGEAGVETVLDSPEPTPPARTK